MPATVRLKWTWIYWNHDYTWAEDIASQLLEKGISIKSLERCVYVIRANGLFAIKYPRKNSPVLYIGEGNFKSRLQRHKQWLGDLIELVGDYCFQIGIALPRVRNCSKAYKDCEAALIQHFQNTHGAAPLFNKQVEKQKYCFEYLVSDIKDGLSIGKGVRYHWAITPMPSCSFFKAYHKTKKE